MNIKKIIPTTIKQYARKHPRLLNVIDSIFHQRGIAIYNDIETMLYHDEKEYLYKLAKQAKNVILEIGTYAGGSTYFLGKGAEISGAHVYSIDPFDSFKEIQINEEDGSNYWNNKEKKPSKQDVEKALKKHNLENRVTLIEGFSREVAQQWGYGNIDFLWIDGNHKEVFDDFYAWKYHLAPNAVVAFHDTNYPAYGRLDVSNAALSIINNENARVIGKVKSITAIKFH